MPMRKPHTSINCGRTAYVAFERGNSAPGQSWLPRTCGEEEGRRGEHTCMRPASRGCRAPAVVISGKKRSSVVLRRHQGSSGAIRGPQAPSGVLRRTTIVRPAGWAASHSSKRAEAASRARPGASI